ncbi:hypothetical protein DYB30_013148, partial [Aphanomyces astaci]
MEAVVKSLRRREGDATSETYSLQALEMFVSIYPSPKTLTVHARFLERLGPCVDTREPISAPVPISKSPSLCLQGFQLALKNEDLPSLLLASLLVLNLNRDMVTFKQPFTWETMHLQLAKKLLDAMPHTDSNALSRSLVWHHVCECLSSLNFLPIIPTPTTDTSIDWASVAKRMSAEGPLTPFLEKVVLVCLQVQLDMSEHAHLLPLSLPSSSLSKLTWDSCYRIIWKHASGQSSPSIVFHLRKEGLRCLVHANAHWWVLVQQMYKAVMMYEKYSQAKQDALYCDMTHHICELLRLSPTTIPTESWVSIFLWLQHWLSNCTNFPLVDSVIALLTPKTPYPDLLELFAIQSTRKWTTHEVDFSSPLPSHLVPLALRNAKKLDQPRPQQLLYLRLLIRTYQDDPSGALFHLRRAVAYASVPGFNDMADRDWYYMAGKWFKKELFSAVIDWCSVLLPFFPKCYLLLGLSYQQLAKWDLAVDAMAAGALLQHVPVEKYVQILYKVAPEVGCNSLKSVPPLYSKVAPLLANQVEHVWLVQCRRQTGSKCTMLQYGLSLWKVVDPTSVRRRRVETLATYIVDGNPRNLIDSYHTLLQDGGCYQWVLHMELQLVARYASLPVSQFDPVEALHLIWTNRPDEESATALQPGATLLGLADLY